MNKRQKVTGFLVPQFEQNDEHVLSANCSS